jgi:NADH-quinone oxidoreductase subunit N
LSDLAGLCRRSPLVAFCMMIFMLSLAGIPPLAGFFGKFYIFAAAVGSKDLGLLWLVILAIAMSAVSLYYYLQVLKQIYVVDGPGLLPGQQGAPVLSQAVLAVIALAVVVLGCAPDLIVGRLLNAIKLAGL